MQCQVDPNSCGHLNQSESVDINESFLKSDIAEIISKIYTPNVRMSETTQGSGATLCRETLGQNNERELTNWKLDKSAADRFGFYEYVETVTSETDVRIVTDSTTSDEVSLPNIGGIPLTHGYICKCCRRKIQSSVSKRQVKTECNNCKRKFIVKNQAVEKSPLMSTVTIHPPRPLWEQVSDENRENPINKSLKCGKSAPALVYNSQTNAKQETLVEPKQEVRFKPKQHTRCSGYVERLMPVDNQLQVVPDITAEYANCDRDVVKSNSSTKVAKKTIFKRVVNSVSASWPVMFYKKTKQSTHLFRADNIGFQNIQNNDDIRYLLECQEQTSQFVRCSHTEAIKRNQEFIKRNSGKFDNEMREDDKVTTKFGRKQAAGEPELSNYFHYSQLGLSSINENNDHKRRDSLTKSISIDNITRIINTETHENVKIEEEKCNVDIQAENSKKPLLNTEFLWQSSLDQNDWATRFWARFFGFCHSVLSFFTTFILQFFTFILRSLARPLLWDSIQIASEHIFQPFLEVLLTGVLKPFFTFMQSVAESFRDFCLPVAQSLGHFLREISYICRACRLIEINTNSKNGTIQNL